MSSELTLRGMSSFLFKTNAPIHDGTPIRIRIGDVEHQAALIVTAQDEKGDAVIIFTPNTELDRQSEKCQALQDRLQQKFDEGDETVVTKVRQGVLARVQRMLARAE